MIQYNITIPTEEILDNFLFNSSRGFVSQDDDIGSALSVAKFSSKLAQLESGIGFVRGLYPCIPSVGSHGNIDDIISPIRSGLVEDCLIEWLGIPEIIIYTAVLDRHLVKTW